MYAREGSGQYRKRQTHWSAQTLSICPLSATNAAVTFDPTMLTQINLSLRTAQSLFGLVLLASSLPAADLPKEILLWPNGAPGSEGKTGDENVRIADNGESVLSNIHKPNLTPYLPSADKATGCAVIVAYSRGHFGHPRKPRRRWCHRNGESG